MPKTCDSDIPRSEANSWIKCPRPESFSQEMTQEACSRRGKKRKVFFSPGGEKQCWCEVGLLLHTHPGVMCGKFQVASRMADGPSEAPAGREDGQAGGAIESSQCSATTLNCDSTWCANICGPTPFCVNPLGTGPPERLGRRVRDGR